MELRVGKERGNITSFSAARGNHLKNMQVKSTASTKFIVCELSVLRVMMSLAVVVITKNLPLFTTPGNIGLKFFERVHAIFDFNQSVVNLKGK